MKEAERERSEERTGEDPQERTARELIELLNELRVILPGVQFLFVFLLTVPFVTLLCTAIATALLMAPSAHHRVLWREGVREQRLKMGNTLTIAGLVFLVPAMLGAVFVIADFIFGHTAAVVLTMALILFFALLWFALPFWYRSDGEA
jgi:hypothetical protein